MEEEKPKMMRGGNDPAKMAKARWDRAREKKVQDPEEPQTWIEAVRWVMENLSDTSPALFPCKKALEIWTDARKNPGKFRKEYMPLLLRAERETNPEQTVLPKDEGTERIEELIGRYREDMRASRVSRRSAS